MDPESGDFQLSGISPCINMGTPDTTGLFLPPEDLWGNHRIYGGRIDIGAHEYSGPTIARPGTDRLDGTDFLVYPNPSSGLLLLACRERSVRDDLVLRILHAGGQVIMEKQVDAGIKFFPVDISHQPRGIYVLTLTSGHHVLFRQKIIKE
jgi:hypothetical protein